MSAQTIDWPSIRAAAVAIGVRAAARQAAADLPPDEQTRFVERVMRRSSREGWIVRKTQLQEAHRLEIVTNGSGATKPMSAPVRMSADIVANELADASKETKLNLVKATRSAAKAFADRTGDAVITGAKALKEIAGTASLLHGWEEQREKGLGLTLGIQINLGSQN